MSVRSRRCGLSRRGAISVDEAAEGALKVALVVMIRPHKSISIILVYFVRWSRFYHEYQAAKIVNCQAYSVLRAKVQKHVA
jgi:hypothetical protein